MSPSFDVPVMTPKQLLLAAADYMEKHGKARGVFQNRRGAVCAVGALRMVTSGFAAYEPVVGLERSEYMRSCEVISQSLGDATEGTNHGLRITVWSDRVNKSTVVSQFRVVAATL